MVRDKNSEYTIDEVLAQRIIDENLFGLHSIQTSDRLLWALMYFAENKDDHTRKFLLQDDSLRLLLEKIHTNNQNWVLDKSEISYSTENVQKIRNYLITMPEYREWFPLTHDYFGADDDFALLVDYVKSDLRVVNSLEDFVIFLSKIAENKKIVAKNFDTSVQKYFAVYINTMFEPYTLNLRHSVLVWYQETDPSIISEITLLDQENESSDEDKEDINTDETKEVLFDKFITVFEFITQWDDEVLGVLKALGDGDDIFTLFDLDKNII